MSSVESKSLLNTLATGWLMPITLRPIRAPFSPPRKRAASGAKAAAARDWLCTALEIERDAHVEVTAWTASGPSGRAHTTAFVARDSSRTVAFAVFKDLDELGRDDVFAAAKSAARVQRS